MGGHSILEQTTLYGRGTPGYRAPELLLLNNRSTGSENSSFSKKSDIWALGCILYELVFGEQPFPSDMSAREYVTAGRALINPISLEYIAPYSGAAVIRLLSAMLDRAPARRPSAKVLCENFSLMSRLSSIICEAEPFDRAYSYLHQYSPRSLPNIWPERDLVDLMSRYSREENAVDISSLAAALGSLTPYENAALRKFIDHCHSEPEGLVDLYPLIISISDTARIRLPMIGLALGPRDFDLYILESNSKLIFDSLGSWDRVYDIMMTEICIKRH